VRDKALFIVIEGLDGTGKTTTGELLAARLNATFMDSLPGPYREYQKAFYSILDDHGWYLHMMSMLTHLSANIREVLATGRPVVLTRYWYTTWAYYAAKCDNKVVRTLSIHPAELNIIQPDFAIFLALEDSERLRRLSLRDEKSSEDMLTEKQEFQKLLLRRYSQLPLESLDILGKSPDEVVDALLQHMAPT